MPIDRITHDLFIMIGFVRVQQGDTGAVTFDFLVFFIKNHTCSRQIIGQPHCADVRVNDLVAVADIAVFQLMLSEICEDFAIGLFGGQGHIPGNIPVLVQLVHGGLLGVCHIKITFVGALASRQHFRQLLGKGSQINCAGIFTVGYHHLQHFIAVDFLDGHLCFFIGLKLCLIDLNGCSGIVHQNKLIFMFRCKAGDIIGRPILIKRNLHRIAIHADVNNSVLQQRNVSSGIRQSYADHNDKHKRQARSHCEYLC